AARGTDGDIERSRTEVGLLSGRRHAPALRRDGRPVGLRTTRPSDDSGRRGCGHERDHACECEQAATSMLDATNESQAQPSGESNHAVHKRLQLFESRLLSAIANSWVKPAHSFRTSFITVT